MEQLLLQKSQTILLPSLHQALIDALLNLVGVLVHVMPLQRKAAIAEESGSEPRRQHRRPGQLRDRQLLLQPLERPPCQMHLMSEFNRLNEEAGAQPHPDQGWERHEGAHRTNQIAPPARQPQIFHNLCN